LDCYCICAVSSEVSKIKILSQITVCK